MHSMFGSTHVPESTFSILSSKLSVKSNGRQNTWR